VGFCASSIASIPVHFLCFLVLPSGFVHASIIFRVFFAFFDRISTAFKSKNYAPGSPGSGSGFLGEPLHVPGGRVPEKISLFFLAFLAAVSPLKSARGGS
jgi:hypothetical protein